MLYIVHYTWSCPSTVSSSNKVSFTSSIPLSEKNATGVVAGETRSMTSRGGLYLRLQVMIPWSAKKWWLSVFACLRLHVGVAQSSKFWKFKSSRRDSCTCIGFRRPIPYSGWSSSSSNDPSHNDDQKARGTPESPQFERKWAEEVSAWWLLENLSFSVHVIFHFVSSFAHRLGKGGLRNPKIEPCIPLPTVRQLSRSNEDRPTGSTGMVLYNGGDSRRPTKLLPAEKAKTT